MAEGLTKEAIDHICDLMELHKSIEAIKALRAAWPFGLKEAKDFLDQYRGDTNGLRNQLLQMANIKEGAVFENSYLRVELKKTGASFLETHRFLMEVLHRLNLNRDGQETAEAFMEAAELLLAEASFDDINELCARLMIFADRPRRVS